MKAILFVSKINIGYKTGEAVGINGAGNNSISLKRVTISSDANTESYQVVSNDALVESS